MLSIGKLASGQAGYYLERAHGSVTRAGVVNSGVEGYYPNGIEGAGQRTGACAALSRGSQANRLDAPGPGRPHDRLHALVAALGHSTAQTLASEGAHR
jgi:hypothetical protein